MGRKAKMTMAELIEDAKEFSEFAKAFIEEKLDEAQRSRFDSSLAMPQEYMSEGDEQWQTQVITECEAAWLKKKAEANG